MTESFPRQEARTRRFSLGAPRAFHVSPDGARVVFLRAGGGADPVTCLWVLDVADGRERLVADPKTLAADTEDLPPEERARRARGREDAGRDPSVPAPKTLAAATEDLPPEERARRERVREHAGGIVAYATDQAVTVA